VYAGDFLETLVTVSNFLEGHGEDAELSLFAPFVWIKPHGLVAEFSTSASRSGSNNSSAVSQGVVILRVYCRATPVPIISDGSAGTEEQYMSPRTAAFHLIATSMWRGALGDDAGMEERRAAAHSMLLHEAALGVSFSPEESLKEGRRFSSEVPVPSLIERHLKLRKRPRKCAARLAVPGEDGSVPSAKMAVSRLYRYDGRELLRVRCGELTSDLASFARAALDTLEESNAFVEPLVQRLLSASGPRKGLYNRTRQNASSNSA